MDMQIVRRGNTINPNNTLMLYDKGDECVPITGGWTRGEFNVGSFTKNPTNMQLSASSSQANKYFNTLKNVNAIDLTGYSKLKVLSTNIRTSGTKIYTHLSVTFPEYTNYDTNNILARTGLYLGEDLITEIDVSGINTSVYIQPFIEMWEYETVNVSIIVKQIWLER